MRICTDEGSNGDIPLLESAAKQQNVGQLVLNLLATLSAGFSIESLDGRQKQVFLFYLLPSRNRTALPVFGPRSITTHFPSGEYCTKAPSPAV
jgi:hypothetical protein